MSVINQFGPSTMCHLFAIAYVRREIPLPVGIIAPNHQNSTNNTFPESLTLFGDDGITTVFSKIFSKVRGHVLCVCFDILCPFFSHAENS